MKSLLLWMIALVLVCVISGRWQPHLVSDSASYLDYPFSSSEAMARSGRLPVYPAILRIAQAISPSVTAGLQVVVVLHIVLQAFTVSLLTIELLGWGLQRWTVVAAAAAVAIGCPFWDNVSTIATDCGAMSLGVMTATCILRGWRIGVSTRLAVAIAICTVVAISLRPAYLFLLPWSILMLLVRPHDATPTPWRRRWRDVATFMTLPSIVLLSWCLFRFSVAGDFSLLPFGHQNMAAVTTQLLDNDELKRIPGRAGKLAKQIANRRVQVSGGAGDFMGSRRRSADGLDLRATSDPSLRRIVHDDRKSLGCDDVPRCDSGRHPDRR